MEREAERLLVQGSVLLDIDLNDEQKNCFSLYIDLLRRWGKKMNLTSRLSPGDIAVYHFLDSLSAVPLITGEAGDRLADIGSGAGFPALPLKICLPNLKVSLVESSHKRASFCREVIRRLRLSDTAVYQARGEEAARQETLRGRFDLVVTRAVGQGGKMVKLCLPFLRPGGRLILYMGALDDGETRALSDEADHMDASFKVHPVQVPYLESPRNLVEIRRST